MAVVCKLDPVTISGQYLKTQSFRDCQDDGVRQRQGGCRAVAAFGGWIGDGNLKEFSSPNQVYVDSVLDPYSDCAESSDDLSGTARFAASVQDRDYFR